MYGATATDTTTIAHRYPAETRQPMGKRDFSLSLSFTCTAASPSFPPLVGLLGFSLAETETRGSNNLPRVSVPPPQTSATRERGLECPPPRETSGQKIPPALLLIWQPSCMPVLLPRIFGSMSRDMGSRYASLMASANERTCVPHKEPSGGKKQPLLLTQQSSGMFIIQPVCVKRRLFFCRFDSASVAPAATWTMNLWMCSPFRGEVCNLFPFFLCFLKTVAVGGVTRAFIYLRAIVREAPAWAPSLPSVCLLSWALYNTCGGKRVERLDRRPMLACAWTHCHLVPQRVLSGGVSLCCQHCCFPFC